jgi:FlaA1/EpsC-like NDP-sugar epimerase
LAAIVTISKAVALYGAIFFSILVWFAFPGVPRSIGLLQPLIFFMLVGSSRAFARIWLSRIVPDRRAEREGRLLIYGAGAAGAQIAEVMQQKQPINLVGFLDDDVSFKVKPLMPARFTLPAKSDV